MGLVLQSGMRRLFIALLLCVATAAYAQPVRGVIVKLRTAADATGREAPQAQRERVASVARDAGVSLHSHDAVGSRGHYLMRLPAAQQGATLETTLRRLRLHPDVLAVEPDVLLKPMAAPNDPSFAAQWHLQAPASFAGAMNAVGAWNTTTGTAAITVAVLDTGIRPHPDLAGRYWPGYDFVSEVDFANDGNGRDADPSDPGDWISAADAANPVFAGCSQANSSWHGTFIAGIIAAATNNGSFTSGITWNTKILPVRVSGKCGAFLSDILDAMRWAAGLSVAGVPANPNPARIINLSFGGDAACSASYQDVINEVTAAGTLVVVAAGNDSTLAKRPADCANVLAVGASNQQGTKASYSNVGPTIALIAPGGVTTSSVTSTGIISLGNSGTTSPGADNVTAKQGTSFSAPMAAGVAALMLAVNPSLSPAQLIARMKAGVRSHVFNVFLPNCSTSFAGSCNCNTSVCGAGLLDAPQAVTQAQAPAAVIAAVPTPLPGATISLDGRSSAASLGGASITAYAWSLQSGPSVTLLNAANAQASAALPGTAGTFVFKLRVTDSLGRSGEDSITVTSVAPVVVTTPSAGSSGGGGGGSVGWLWGLGLWAVALLSYRRAKRGPATGV